MSKLGKAFYSTLYVIAAILPMKFAAVPALAQYDKDMFMYRGRSALADGKFSLAIENFNVLARLDTTDYENYFFRGIAKYNLVRRRNRNLSGRRWLCCTHGIFLPTPGRC